MRNHLVKESVIGLGDNGNSNLSTNHDIPNLNISHIPIPIISNTIGKPIIPNMFHIIAPT